MRAGTWQRRWATGVVTAVVMLLAAPAASAQAAASVRFVNALPGAGAAHLDASEGGVTQRVARSVRFGDVGGYVDVPAGQVTLEARTGRGATVARQRLDNGARYTAIVTGDGQATLAVLRDGGARAGRAAVRIVHAAPELGAVDVRLGARTLARNFGFQQGARYTAADPGTYDVRVTRPGGRGAAIASSSGVTLTAGTSSTAFVVGSAGRAVRVVVAPDDTAAPAGAPATGLGGIADGESSLIAAIAAGLLAAVLGASAYLAVTGRPRRRGR